MDLSGAGGLLGQSAGRSARTVTDSLDARGQGWKNAVQVVAIDPCAAYRTAVERALPHATIVADHFHLVRLANEMVTDVRQRVAREQLGRRGRKADPAWAKRRLLLRAGNRLSGRALDRLMATFDRRSDPTGELGAAWGVKERLRMLLAARDRHTIAHRLHRFHETVLSADLPEATRLARTVDAWWPEILAFCETRITNAGTEGTTGDQRRRPDRLRVSQLGQLTPPGTVPLHPANPPDNQCRGVGSPSSLRKCATNEEGWLM